MFCQELEFVDQDFSILGLFVTVILTMLITLLGQQNLQDMQIDSFHCNIPPDVCQHLQLNP